MMSYSDYIKNLESIFTLDKVRKDLYKYLPLDNNNSIEIESNHEITGEVKRYYLSNDEEINLLSIVVQKKYFMLTFFHYRIEIVIGEYFHNEASDQLQLNKGIAELFYNSEYELITLEFLHY